MNHKRNPLLDPNGHATIPPDLRPFLEENDGEEEEAERAKNPAVNAAFVQIQDAIGEDVQEINPDVGVGNKSAYVGPALVPGGAKGRAFTAKVKIIESAAAEAEEEAAAEKVPAVAVAKGATENGGRGRSIAVAIAALGIVVAVGGWIVAKGPREVARPAASGAAIVAPAVPAVGASSAVVPSAAATAGVDAGASLAPSAPTGVAPAPYKGKGVFVKGEDPYDAAAPLPVKTVEVVVPPPPSAVPTVTPIVIPSVTPTARTPTDSTAPKGLPYRKKDQ
jgi:hypothetical protein